MQLDYRSEDVRSRRFPATAGFSGTGGARGGSARTGRRSGALPGGVLESIRQWNCSCAVSPVPPGRRALCSPPEAMPRERVRVSVSPMLPGMPSRSSIRLSATLRMLESLVDLGKAACVTIDQILHSHRGAAETVRRLWGEFRTIRGSHSASSRTPPPVCARLPLNSASRDYTQIREGLHELLDAEFRAGRIA